MNGNTVIALSKTKILLLIAGALGFVLLGYWMVQLGPAEAGPQPWFSSLSLVHGIGMISIIFFGACFGAALKKLIDKTPGLVLDSSGLHDNSSGISAGFVPWSDITGFGVWELDGQQILVVKVLDPQKYIARGGLIGRQLKRANLKLTGSSVTISATALKIDFAELSSLCEAYLLKYGAV
ncbi:MAG: hypothetical protein LBE21_09200 [Pseudomonadales bacterium]|jgi:hypothetical protein|nr:hypothetical protein [Pseudomonadales bacterium]